MAPLRPGDLLLTPPLRRGMWTLAGQGWWRGRALAAWVTEAARKGASLASPRDGPGTAAESRPPDRRYSSANRKVTALSHSYFKPRRVLLVN